MALRNVGLYPTILTDKSYACLERKVTVAPVIGDRGANRAPGRPLAALHGRWRADGESAI